jgi:tRNA threonylcarbamoyladenosine biosynthesis protein TsaE
LDQVVADLTGPGGVVGLHDGTVVASLRFRHDGASTFLRRVAVVPEFQRRAVGSRLVAWTHALLARRGDGDELRVGVRTARPGARRFWEGLGYVPSTQHDYWQELRRPLPYAGTVATPAAMRELGQRLSVLVSPGDLVLCIGGLGAGKTTFAQGLGAGLDVTGPVTSPTFVLAREHQPRLGGRGVSFVHVDAYRLGAVADPLAELDALDLDTALGDAVTYVEWGEGLVEQLAAARIEIRIEVESDGAGDGGIGADSATETRRVVIDALGHRWAGVDLREALAGPQGHRSSALT